MSLTLNAEIKFGIKIDPSCAFLKLVGWAVMANRVNASFALCQTKELTKVVLTLFCFPTFFGCTVLWVVLGYISYIGFVTIFNKSSPPHVLEKICYHIGASTRLQAILLASVIKSICKQIMTLRNFYVEWNMWKIVKNMGKDGRI